MTRHLVVIGMALATAGTVSLLPLEAQTFNLPPGASMTAPDPNVPLYFEAASVKQNKEGGPGVSINRQPGGRFLTRNAPLTGLIAFAYRLQGYQLVGDIPDWARNDRWDIVAKFEGDPPPVSAAAGADHMMLAMRTLMADRFKLKVRRETREMDIYALVMTRAGGKPGPALKQNNECREMAAARAQQEPGATQGPPRRADGSPILCGFQAGPGFFRLNSSSMAQFSNGISSRVGRQVVDRTGLEGDWSFELIFAPPANTPPPPPGANVPTPDPNAPDLFTAVQEQLGLKLESTKGPVEVIVVESVERPTED